MRVVVFCHSLVSDWNHGNAHFLRGVLSELIARGHEVRVWEPEGAWSLKNLLAAGIEVATRIRADASLGRPTVVLVTGDSSAETVAHAAAVGCDGYLVKPVEPEELQSALRVRPTRQT